MLAHFVINAACTQLFELIVEIKDSVGMPLEAARRTAGERMKADV